MAPRITHQSAAVDLDAAERAAADMLAALGLPIDDEDMVETPRRMVHAYAEMLTVPEFDLTTFPNDEGYDELVLVADIPVRSLCEHHMLPFVGRRARRLPAGRPDPRAVEVRPHRRVLRPPRRRPRSASPSRSPTTSPNGSQPRGVGVVIEAEHTCMSLRGARADGAHDGHLGAARPPPRRPARRAEFLALTRDRRAAR